MQHATYPQRNVGRPFLKGFDVQKASLAAHLLVILQTVSKVPVELLPLIVPSLVMSTQPVAFSLTILDLIINGCDYGRL